VSVRALTTALELCGVALLTGAAFVAFGIAAGLAVAGGACIAASFAISRGSA